METKKGRVVVNYCGGWGYWSKAAYVQEAIENQFPSTFDFELARDKGRTGRLEVTVFIGGETTGHLVHSKDNGQGFVTDKNVDSLLEAVGALL